MEEDPEQHRVAWFVLEVPYFGRARHADDVARAVARNIHYGVNSEATLWSTSDDGVKDRVEFTP